jgi:hypothetical protein
MLSVKISATLLALLATTTRLVAQSNDCFAKLPPKAFTRVPVLIDTKADDSQSAILPAADILTQILTERIRKSLGSETGPLPTGDSVTSWRQTSGSVVVTVHHDGTFSWRKDSTAIASFTGTGGLDILTRALSESLAAGDRVFWPEGAKQDSLSYHLSFVAPSVRRNGKLEPLKVRIANPAFTLMIPWYSPPEMIEQLGVPTGKYKPATIAGCPINENVRQS